MRQGVRFAFFVVFCLAEPFAGLAETSPMTREAYRANLVECLKRSKLCSEARLRDTDREFLAFEGRGQTFPGDVANRIADRQMSDFIGRDGTGAPVPPAPPPPKPTHVSPIPEETSPPGVLFWGIVVVALSAAAAFLFQRWRQRQQMTG